MSKRAAEKTYRPKGYGISPSLARARAPFRVQNTITGLTLFGFAVSVWAYSIHAVKQDNFDDIDFEAINTTVEEKAKRVSLEDEAKSRQKAFAEEKVVPVVVTESVPPIVKDAGRGILPTFSAVQNAGLYRSGESSLVWDAPPIDRLGRLGEHLSTRDK